MPMPWWAIAYLVILTVVILISVIKDYFDKRSLPYISGEIISGALGFIFIVGYWKDDLANTISWLVIPLLLFAIAWDQYALSKMKILKCRSICELDKKDIKRHYEEIEFVFIVLFINYQRS